ncbi:hypothetical protein PsalN5692_01739 [Piscirickettsia salmonis]|uniref:hypothetical protein n=1 Tax=Piscirickettsia salmonis TaxID=1238 RepID=UPI0012B82EF2|nr:hypothetical protein [Piscirickettsia salmonis]QGP50277.1 hypothetical protein PsalN5692_01739 [Piscirickettsia salmonis]
MTEIIPIGTLIKNTAGQPNPDVRSPPKIGPPAAAIPPTLPQIPRKRRYLGRYFAHPMMQNRRAKRDDYKPSAVRVTQRCVP